jgi:hypothetical protein
MEKDRLKSLIATGTYRPDPCDVAQAMLRRRAVRELLIGGPAGLPVKRADRIQPSSAAPRQAA